MNATILKNDSVESANIIPTSEVWLYKNKEALSSVQKGLRESAADNITSLCSFASFIEE